MRLFIDCEFNEFKGELISMGIISDDGKSFYEVLPCVNPKSWVKEHVMPILGKEPISLPEFQNILQNYLMQFESIELIADWPDDIKLFCEALVLEGGYRLNTPQLTMAILRNLSSEKSTLPHNAMNDAKAIKEDFYNNANDLSY